MTDRCAGPGFTTVPLPRLAHAKAKGFRVNINCTLFSDAVPERVARFFDDVMTLGVDGITVSPGYAYERAPDQQHFLNRTRTKQLFRDIFRRRSEGAAGRCFNRGCSSISSPAIRPITALPGAIRRAPCSAGSAPATCLAKATPETFKELMQETEWDKYGTGNYEKCADCMVHSGFEATAVMDSVSKPWKLAKLALAGIKTEGPMAPDIPLDRQRPAELRVLNARRAAN